MHPEQRAFCEGVKRKLPGYFKGVKVIDFGSLDINGNNRYLFEDSEYTGIDIGPGANVDVVCRAKDYVPFELVDTVISTEMLEHDEEWKESLRHMVRVVRPGGLIMFTCATTGRVEHGTARTTPGDAPYVGDYYRNLTQEDVASVWDFPKIFSLWNIETGPPADLRFWGLVRVGAADKIED